VSAAPVRVVLADDHTLVRAGLRRVLEAHPDIAVVGEADTGHAAIALAHARGFDVLVLDLNMPDGDGFAVLRAVKALPHPPPVVVLTMHAGREYVARAVREGADAYLLKDAAVHDLVAAVQAVVRGRRYFSAPVQSLMADWVAGAGSPGRANLTQREHEVLRWLARGLSSREVAERLSIGVRTVETHRAHLMHKLEVKSVATLIQVALREGLIDPPAVP
jgi:two-component system response regulator NreC